VTKSNEFGKNWQVGGRFENGSSGGPVFSTNGMLVGLVVAGYEKTNISYVVPINLFSSFFQAAGMELQHCPQVSQVLPLKYFKDCEDCPEMVVVQAGDFLMGSPKEERDRQSSEGPQHMVRISRPFAVGRYAVTVKEFRAFTNETGREPDAGCFVWDQKDQAWKFDLKNSYISPGFREAESQPVVCVNWYDANAYVQWLSNKTGHEYRLLSEAEREYVTRAGKQTPYWWGSFISAELANYSSENYLGKTVPVWEFRANPFGLFQVHGNIFEWVEDCWHEAYIGAPDDGAAWKSDTGCNWRTIRGGAWFVAAEWLRSAARSSGYISTRDWMTGFRVARAVP
jgi:formylglycine-generating enzyme required for sulfatase activity